MAFGQTKLSDIFSLKAYYNVMFHFVVDQSTPVHILRLNKVIVSK